ncbi:allatostatins [Trichogramma pretiosum]|uniref:allatostatins n=1 Tax=Trichogramma pretiosum TaxID=7493 RepID=UPI0006C96713|nr:allatostatins [Trichogramma pretiosum]
MRGYATSFCVLSLLGACTLAMDESSPSSSSLLRSSSSGGSVAASDSNSVSAAASMSSSSLVSGLSQHAPRAEAAFLRIPAKRAFTYRTEFKRLPLYQFGLGKRSRSYAFGLGKRGKQYAFGLGKRSNVNSMSEYEQQQQLLQRLRPDQMQAALDYLSSSNEDANYDKSDYWLEKRSAGAYNFGLGKRSPGSYYEPDEQRLLLPVKQLRNNKYVFGLGKRRLYDVLDSSGSSSSDSDDVEDLELELSDDEANSQ